MKESSHTYTCDVTGAKSPGVDAREIDGDDEIDPSLPDGWAEVVLRRFAPNPEWARIQETREGMIQHAIAQKEAQTPGVPFTEDEMEQLRETAESVVPGDPIVVEIVDAHLSPKQADKLVSRLRGQG